MAEVEGKRIGVVLSGAAARGAFQAGALARLIPALLEEGYQPSVFLGSSAGAINAALWASYADLAPEETGQRVTDTWRNIDSNDIYRHPAATLLLTDAPRFFLSIWGIGNGVPALLNTAPLQRNAKTLLSPEKIAANVRAGHLDGVGVTGTRIPPSDPARSPQNSTERARTVLFVDAPTLPVEKMADPLRAVDVAAGPITTEQVLASSALPLGFPPVWVGEPADHAGWYVDGGVRLNSPLRPAISVGMDRLVIIDSMPTDCGGELPPTPAGEPIPPVSESAALLLDSVLGDQLAEDVRSVMATNHLVEQAEEAGMTLTAPDGTPLRSVPLMLVSPEPGELSSLAGDIIEEKTSKPLGPIRESEDYALDLLLRGLGDSPGRLELLSFLYFDSDYFEAQLDLGAKAADTALAAGWVTCHTTP